MRAMIGTAAAIALAFSGAAAAAPCPPLTVDVHAGRSVVSSPGCALDGVVVQYDGAGAGVPPVGRFVRYGHDRCR
jgi:hypothetical protein